MEVEVNVLPKRTTNVSSIGETFPIVITVKLDSPQHVKNERVCIAIQIRFYQILIASNI